MNGILDIVGQAKSKFRELLLQVEKSGGMTLQRYVNFLSMQYHLTNGVQKHFYACASHHSLMNRKSLRKFLVNFADEEEPHYLIAEKDLENLDAKPGPCPIDVKLWWAYFDKIVLERPFVRLGATCILENISAGNGDVIKRLLAGAKYANPRNTRFLIIHQHEDLPHGDQILDALKGGKLDEQQLRDLEEGAAMAMKMYLRMFSEACLEA